MIGDFSEKNLTYPLKKNKKKRVKTRGVLKGEAPTNKRSLQFLRYYYIMYNF